MLRLQKHMRFVLPLTENAGTVQSSSAANLILAGRCSRPPGRLLSNARRRCGDVAGEDVATLATTRRAPPCESRRAVCSVVGFIPISQNEFLTGEATERPVLCPIDRYRAEADDPYGRLRGERLPSTTPGAFRRAPPQWTHSRCSGM